MKPRYSRTSLVRTAMVVVGAPLCLFLAGCNKDEKEEGLVVTVQAAPAQKTDILRVVSAESIIFPVAQSAITPKINAPVRHFLVTHGPNVRNEPLFPILKNHNLS